MENSYIPRTLWFTENDHQKEISQEDLLLEQHSLIILGEAGMGKTKLLQWLGKQPSYTYCTAKQLIRRERPEELLGNAKVLVIDALDEAPSHQENDAIDEVLRKLDRQNCPRFVLSCRVAEWRSATATSNITETYGQAPLQLHLKPFSKAEIEFFLTQKVGSSKATEVLEHFERLGLNDWLGNPQTLDLISTISHLAVLPKSRSELFDLATQKLAVEHNEQKAEQQLPTDVALKAAGAVCASLVLCGQTAIVRKAAARLIEGELLLQDLKQLPGAESIDQVLNTRLFIATAPDQFVYMHRRIAEYLAARWLAGLANTDRKRSLLIRMFQHQGLIPVSLRGVYAWLAHDPMLCNLVIQTDPIALLEYGEVDQLPPRQARLLLQSLERIELENPRQLQPHSWKARCFAQPELLADVQNWLERSDQQFVRLRVLVIESLKGTEMAKLVKTALLKIASSPDEFYITRSAASAAITAVLSEAETTQLLNSLETSNSEDSLRLALDIAHKRGFESISASRLARVALAYAATGNQMAGKFFQLQRDISLSQISEFLETLTTNGALSNYEDLPFSTEDLADLSFGLIARSINANKITATQFLSWIKPFPENHAFQESDSLAKAFLNKPQFRHSVQKIFFLQDSCNERSYINHYQLTKYSSALSFSEKDIIR